MSRFEVVKEPTGTWSVFDDLFGYSAQQGGRDLLGLSRAEAEFALLHLEHPSYVCKLLRFDYDRKLATPPTISKETGGHHNDVPQRGDLDSDKQGIFEHSTRDTFSM